MTAKIPSESVGYRPNISIFLDENFGGVIVCPMQYIAWDRI